MSEFQWCSALGAKASNAALEPLKLKPLAKDDPRLLLPDHRERLEAFRIPKQAQYALVASLDGVTLLKRNTKDLIDREDLDNSLFKQKPYASQGSGRASQPWNLRSRPLNRALGIRHRNGVDCVGIVYFEEQGTPESCRRDGTICEDRAGRCALLQPG